MSDYVYPPSNLFSAPASEIGLNVQTSSPPTQAYIGKDDSLWVMTATQAAGGVVTVNARILTPSGQIQLNQWSIRTPQSRAGSYTQINLPEGFLLSVAAVCNLTPGGQGSMYVEVLLSRLAPSLFNSAQMLCQGYSTFNQPVTWPSGVSSTSVDCAGAIISATGGVPAAGSDFSVTVPSNAKWQVMSVKATLTTSGTVASRVPQLLLDDGINTFAVCVITGTQPASTAIAYNWAPSYTPLTTSPTNAMQAIPNPTKLGPGFRIRSSTFNIQAGDQWSAQVVLVEEWLQP